MATANQQNNKQSDKHFLDSVVEDTTDVINTEEVEEIEEENENLTQEEIEALELEKEQLAEQEAERLRLEQEGSTTQEDDEFSYVPFVQELIDSKILVSDEEKEYEDSVQGFKELVDDNIRFKFEEYKSNIITPTAVKFIEFLENGGSPDEFITNASAIPDYANFNITDPDTAKNLIRDNLTLLGYDDEDIESQISEFEEINSLEKNAKIAQKRLVKYAEEQLEELTKQQKLQEEQRLNSLKEEDESIKKSIYEREDIAGFKLTKTEKDDFYKFITKPIKDEKGKVTTQYLKEITEEDKIKMAFFKYKKFNFGDVEKKIETKKANELQVQLRKKADKLSGKTSTQEQEETTSTKLPDMFWLP